MVGIKQLFGQDFEWSDFKYFTSMIAICNDHNLGCVISRSEGYLCLPKKHGANFPEAMQKLLEGKFRLGQFFLFRLKMTCNLLKAVMTFLKRWRWRQRIRITVTGENVYEAPIELHDQQLMFPEYRFMDCLQEQHPAAATVVPYNEGRSRQVRILPVLALNEVFIGESLSSR